MTRSPRAGWAEAAMAAADEGGLIDPPTPTVFDEEEWRWPSGTTYAPTSAENVHREEGMMADTSTGREEVVDSGEESGGVLTLVCLKCGKEYYFSDADQPEGMICEKCGNRVFRDFFTAAEGDEAAEDFTDSTARDMNTDDAEGDTLPGDVLDLNRG